MFPATASFVECMHSMVRRKRHSRSRTVAQLFGRRMLSCSRWDFKIMHLFCSHRQQKANRLDRRFFGRFKAMDGNARGGGERLDGSPVGRLGFPTEDKNLVACCFTPFSSLFLLHSKSYLPPPHPPTYSFNHSPHHHAFLRLCRCCCPRQHSPCSGHGPSKRGVPHCAHWKHSLGQNQCKADHPMDRFHRYLCRFGPPCRAPQWTRSQITNRRSGPGHRQGWRQEVRGDSEGGSQD